MRSFSQNENYAYQVSRYTETNIEPKTEADEYFEFEFQGSFKKHQLIWESIRKFKASLKTHQLVSKNSLLREAIDFFLYKYIDKMLDDGEKVMNKYFTSKKKDEYLRPNVIIQVSLIDLSWRTSAEESYKRISIKF